jgi:hypothetical protein
MHRIAFEQTDLRSRVQKTPRLRSIFHALHACKTINFRANETRSGRSFQHSEEPQRLIILVRDPPRPARR